MLLELNHSPFTPTLSIEVWGCEERPDLTTVGTEA